MRLQKVRASWANRGRANVGATFTGGVFQLVSIVIVVWGVFLVLEGQITIGAQITAQIRDRSTVH